MVGPSDDKGMVLPVASNPASSRHPFKLSGIVHPVSDPEIKKLKEVFNSNKEISEMIHVESSSSDVYYCENDESLFELDECFGPQLSTSEDKNTTCKSSKEAKETCTNKKKMQQTIEVGENSTFPLPSTGERVAQRKRKVEPKKMTKEPQKKAKLQKKIVNTSSEVEILKARVDGHDDAIKEINLQLRVLTDKVSALEDKDSGVEPKKTTKVPKKKDKLQKKNVETSSEVEKLKSRVDVHDQAIKEINLQLEVLIDKVDPPAYGDSEEYYSSDSE